MKDLSSLLASHGLIQEEDPDSDPFLKQMNRGSYLSQLRLLALQDEAERSAEEEYTSKVENLHAEVQILSNGQKMLNYSVYLSHQRYFDDLKHVDMHFMNFGCFVDTKSNADATIPRIESSNDVRILDGQLKHEQDLIIEQRKSLGKGGLCWDAAFILGEHVIYHEMEWNIQPSGLTSVLELGAGTGLCGLMVAKATSANVTITDLPELVPLMEDNVKRNLPCKGNITAQTLRWGNEADYHGKPYDVIVGADIVTNLYDPVALASTIHALSGSETRIYISAKSRLDKPHEIFDDEMKRLFARCDRVKVESRLKSPNVFVMVFGGKKEA
eukprot:scaffold8251_cov61-Cyclotella_meneghiniana.AAC.2